jgi:hypothetical protein
MSANPAEYDDPISDRKFALPMLDVRNLLGQMLDNPLTEWMIIRN